MSAVSLESASIMGCPQIGPSFIVITRIPDKSQTDSAPQWIIAVDARSTWRKSPAFGRGAKVFRTPIEVPAAVRAHWLADMSAALDEARDVLFELDLSELPAGAATDLYRRIEAARLEVRTLRLSRSINPCRRKAPEWIEFDPWQSERPPEPSYTPCGISPPPAKGSR